MSAIAYKCPCGWLVTDGGPDDLWDDTNQLIDDHVEHCPAHENDGPATDQSTGTAEDPNPHQKERTMKNDTPQPTRFHAVWDHAEGDWFVWDNLTLEVTMWCHSGEHAQEEAAALNAKVIRTRLREVSA